MNTETEQQLLHHARNGNTEEVRRLLETVKRKEVIADINCKGRSKSNLGWTPLHLACYFGHRQVVQDLLKAGAEVNVLNDMGDTPLHRAAFTGRKELVMLLLEYDADTTVVNGSGQTAKEATHDKEIRSMLEAVERTQQRKLEELLLAAAREGKTAELTALLNRPNPPDVNCSDQLGNTPLHCAAYRAHKQCALKLLKSGADPNLKNKNVVVGHNTFILFTYFYVVLRIETRASCVLEQKPLDLAQGAEMKHILVGNKVIYKTLKRYEGPLWKSSRFFGWRLFWVVLEHGVLSWYRKQPDAVHNIYRQGCKHLTQAVCTVRNFKLEQEQEKNKILSEALETLATEHHELEQSLVEGSPPLSILSEDEFYDALSDSESEQSLSQLEAVTARSFEEEEGHLNSRKHRMSEGKDCGGGDALSNGIKKHRTSLPSPMFSRNDFSIWSILRKCIGMELSKITMPVIFNEPLSFLQRLTEYMEHTYLIHKASSFSDPVERMQCVAAFAVSAVASQWERTGKPFNPLLGETYELVRDDLGFRLISEQVSHHPPISAFHAEGLNNDFIFHGSIYPKLKFWGKSVEAEPKGTITLELLEHNEAYTWTNPTCCVHNIIVGKLWIEQYGNVEITNHKTGDKCVLNFKPCGLFGKELHKVEGYIQDKSKKKLCALYGKWTECLYSVDPATFDAYKKNDKKNTEEKKNSKQMSTSEESDEMPMPDSESVFVIPGSVLLWRIAPRPPNSAQMYNFTSFAMVLNEVDKEMESVIPKTDCRLRPDIRAMENGEIDQASEEKKRLEEKQRAARKNRSKSEEDWKTRWFHQGPNPYNGAQDWIYSGSYWDRNYFNLPDIY
ncbi:oxysterol-binding protein-related protein 1 isoform X6 [Marmota marmota marmota]|uniref:oxysterol-binding protein-related protein 1 isoform X6 n=1 Tax=Marmota marmota marmota TaxID=9994 RepID=UPI0020934E46|nr:oxysterol-binding protein-related protein 1 isoform X6 [Marmota marmota marmota]